MRSKITVHPDRVIKRYAMPRLFHRELASYRLFDQMGLTGKLVPGLLAYDKKDLTIAISRLEGQELTDKWFTLSEEETAGYHESITRALADIYRNLRTLDIQSPKSVPKALRWNSFLDDTLQAATNRMAQSKNPDVKRIISQAIDTVVQNRHRLITCSNITWLHRDLWQGNILAPQAKNYPVYLIDFEHSIMGPLEFEFANQALLGDILSPTDNKYIYTSRVKKLLITQEDVPYSFDLDNLMAIVYGLEHFGHGALVGTYSPELCVRAIGEKLRLMTPSTQKHTNNELLLTYAQ